MVALRPLAILVPLVVVRDGLLADDGRDDLDEHEHLHALLRPLLAGLAVARDADVGPVALDLALGDGVLVAVGRGVRLPRCMALSVAPLALLVVVRRGVELGMEA